MKTSDLESALDGLNRIILEECFETWTGELNGYASATGKRKGPQHPCFRGLIKGRPSSCSDLEKHIILPSTSQTVSDGSVAVGSVLDDNHAKPEDDLVIVVVVGINYGQGAWYLQNRVHRTSATGMRSRLNSADAAIAAHPLPGCDIQLLPAEFHLVACNFFPWITSLAWSQYEFNAIEEALLLHCFGYSDPHDPLRRMLKKLGSAVTHIVFHGANNAVPLLGTQFVTGNASLLRGPAGRPKVQVLFCDNLARPHLPVANAVGLCLERTGEDEEDVMDRDE